MFDSQSSSQSSVKINSVPWKQRHPSFSVKVKTVELQDIGDAKDWIWIRGTHKRIILTSETGQRFVAAVINALSQMIQPEATYTIWYGFTDLHDRYVEILCVEANQ